MQISLRAARVNAGYTLESAAERTGLSVHAVRISELNPSRAKHAHLEQLCELYGIALSQIFLEEKYLSRYNAAKDQE